MARWSRRRACAIARCPAALAWPPLASCRGSCPLLRVPAPLLRSLQHGAAAVFFYLCASSWCYDANGIAPGAVGWHSPDRARQARFSTVLQVLFLVVGHSSCFLPPLERPSAELLSCCSGLRKGGGLCTYAPLLCARARSALWHSSRRRLLAMQSAVCSILWCTVLPSCRMPYSLLRAGLRWLRSPWWPLSCERSSLPPRGARQSRSGVRNACVSLQRRRGFPTARVGSWGNRGVAQVFCLVTEREGPQKKERK